MNRELKKLWVEALRSGNYKQNKTVRLVDADGKWNPFGVLIDVGFESTWVFDESYEAWACEETTVYMPTWYATAADLDFMEEVLVMQMHCNEKSFKEIAAWIEKHL